MDLFIKTDINDIPIGHPCLKTNLQQAFPKLDFDADTPPIGWRKYISVKPKLGPYQDYNNAIGSEFCAAFGHNGLERKLINGEIVEVWHIDDIPYEERLKKQALEKANWAVQDPAGPASWTFDETTCSYQAPSPYPSDGKEYCWNETAKTWQLAEGVTDFRLIHSSLTQLIVRKVLNS